MSEQEGLIQKIIDDPANDAPRLVYADWLEANGQSERAEFIRTQVELARIHAEDDRRSVLQARERRLLAGNASRWCDDWMLGHRFRRGLLEAICSYGPEDFLERADRVFRAEPVREVWFETPVDGWDPGETATLAASPHLSRVQTLGLPAGRSFGISREALLTVTGSPHLTRLETLELGHGMGCSEIDDETFCEMIGAGDRPMPPAFRALRRLGLNDVRLGDASLAALVASPLADTLTHLDLSSNEQVSHAGILSLVSSPLWSRLTELDASGVHPHPLGRALVAGELGNSRLRRLAMHADLEALSKASSWGPLEALSLRCRSRLVVSELRAFTACRHLAGLSRLDLRGSGLNAEGAGLLAGCPALARLAALNLEGNRELGDDGIAALIASPFLARLAYLNMADTGLTDASLTVLARSPFVARLRALDLSRTEISDRGLLALANSPHLGQLTTLNLEDPCVTSVKQGTTHVSYGSSEAITEAGLRALADSPRLPHLTYFGLRDYQFPEGGWQSLVEGSRIAWPGLSWANMQTDEQREAYKARFGWFDGRKNLEWDEPFFG